MLKRDVHDETVLYEAVSVELFALFLDKREGPKACRNVDEEAVVCDRFADAHSVKVQASEGLTMLGLSTADLPPAESYCRSVH